MVIKYLSKTVGKLGVKKSPYYKRGGGEEVGKVTQYV